MAVRLSGSYLRKSYQLLARVVPNNMSNDVAFERASNIIYEWAKQKFSNVFRLMPRTKATFDDKRDGNEVGLIYDQENGEFIFRCAHPDARVPGRIWITDVEIKKNEIDFLFAVRLSVTSLHSCEEEVPFSCPEFVKFIATNIGIYDVIRIESNHHLLSTKDDVDMFVNFLRNSERRLPVILMSAWRDEGGSGNDQYVMDAPQMACDLLGAAHVFQITQEVNDYFTELVGRKWSVFNGAVRTYYPKLVFDNESYFKHPLITRNKTMLWDGVGNDDATPYMLEIERYVRNYVLGQRVLWEDLGIRFYLAAFQEYLKEQRNTDNQSHDEIITSYEKQLEQLQKQSEENLSIADSYAQDLEECKSNCDEQRRLISKLKAQIIGLRYQLNDIDETVPIDGKYDEINEWIDKYYPDRMELHSRAVRSLKDAVYEDAKLVYRCLKLLANQYYSYRTGQITYEEFMHECKAVDSGLDERAAITDVAAGMQGDEYYVQYRGKRRKLERHLTKGSNKDKRYCLRIYFFWDDENQVVVIGDMPHHLDTSAT